MVAHREAVVLKELPGPKGKEGYLEYCRKRVTASL